MRKIVITAGTGYRASGTPLTNGHQLEALKRIRKGILTMVSGYTETDTIGAWKGGSGLLVHESGKRWEILLVDDAQTTHSIGRQLARHVAAELDQASVVLEISEVQAEFITQGGA